MSDQAGSFIFMCGRYATTRSSADLGKLFEAFDETGGETVPDYNVAPTDRVPIVRVSVTRQSRVVSAARWGLVPPWADLKADYKMLSRPVKTRYALINARAETVATSRAYAGAFERRRCLVPADGWYEWTRTATGKQAHFMTRSVMNRNDYMTMPEGISDGLAFAGIWSAKDDAITFSIITMPARGELARVHDRMPLLLPGDRWEDWLTATVGDDLLTPPSDAFLAGIEIRAVGPAVGDVRNDGPALIEPIEDGRLF